MDLKVSIISRPFAGAASEPPMRWHVLDVRWVWVKEFASALGRQVDTLGWLPEIGLVGRLLNTERQVQLRDPDLQVRSFPVQRGFARFPLRRLAGEGTRICRRLLRQTPCSRDGVLVVVTPNYVDVARCWPGPVVYYVTDLYHRYDRNLAYYRDLEPELCTVATHVCPNSQRLADYLTLDAGCRGTKITIIPNATRAANILGSPLESPAPLPPDAADLPRPVAGVLGNLAVNMDWEFLEEVIEHSADMSWLFVGPTSMPCATPQDEDARQSLKRRGGRIRFVGSKPYGQLAAYARALDVAVLPYGKREPTYSGSSTRFYEHLAACRPVIATDGFEELLHKEPLVKIVRSPRELAGALEDLRRRNFQDGYEGLRWQASQAGTWECRAAAMRAAVMGGL